jgi:hypothetical protein
LPAVASFARAVKLPTDGVRVTVCADPGVGRDAAILPKFFPQLFDENRKNKGEKDVTDIYEEDNPMHSEDAKVE